MFGTCFGFLLGLVLFYFLITSHERSEVLFCAASVVVPHGIVLFTPKLMAPRGDALYRSLVCLSWLATVWIVYEKVKTILNSPATP
jgi:hypothetical protein